MGTKAPNRSSVLETWFMRSKIAVDVLDDEILLTMPGTSFSIIYERTKDNQLIAEPLFWKESPGRKRQNEFPALSIACLDSGKRESKEDWLDSLPTE